MGHSLQVINSKKLIVVIYEGVVTFEELKSARSEILSHPDYQETFDGVCDFRNAHKKLSSDEINALVHLASNDHPSKGRWCTLNSSPIETGQSFLFKQRV